VTLTIDGTLYFSGPVMQVISQLALPVDDTTDPEEVRTREYVLRGVDWNILFDKRIVYNVASPTTGLNIFSPGTTDVSVLETFFDDYIDLTGDGLNVTTFVEEVGDPTPDGADGTYVNPGDPWRKQMESIAGITGAIWYIDAGKNFHYQAYETNTPAWGFSDVPNHTTTFGFRDLEYTEDATNLINQALVWGGSEFGSTGVTKKVVFGEDENVVSQGVHGRWQRAETHFNEAGFFENSGCEIRATNIVYGSPGSKSNGDDQQGLQYPQQNIRLTWFGGGVPTPLEPGSVVDVTLNVFGDPPIELSLPVRQITITFPTSTEVQFEGFLGIQTSDPWSLWKYMRAQNTRPTREPTVITTSDGSAPATPGSLVQVVPTPDPDGSNTTFVLPDPYQATTLQVFLFSVGVTGGTLQRRGIDYNETDPLTGVFDFITAPLNTDTLYVRYYSA
jgi:hypothetical protein